MFRRVLLVVMLMLLIIPLAADAVPVLAELIIHLDLDAERAHYEMVIANGADPLMAQISLGMFQTRTEPERRRLAVFEELVVRYPAAMNEILARHNMTYIAATGERFGKQ